MVTEQKKKVIDLYNQGLALYKQRKWEQAMNAFTQALQIDPKDGPSELYLQRAREFSQNPPPDDWDGVFVMTTK